MCGDIKTQVLRWSQPEVWGPCIAKALKRERCRTRLRSVPGEQALDVLAWELAQSFSHISLFHGCRPVDTSVYYRQGIRRHDATVVERARAFFRSQDIPDMALEVAIAETDLRSDEGRVFFALDGEHLVRQAGQYLIYGSESIMAIAATLQRMGHRDTLPALTRVGRPALFRCDIPINGLSFAVRRELAATFYQRYRRARGRLPKRVGSIDHAVVLREDVPPEAIRAHVEPPVIIDWHRHGAPYRVTSAM